MRVQLGACTNATAVTAEMCKCAIIYALLPVHSWHYLAA